MRRKEGRARVKERGKSRGGVCAWRWDTYIIAEDMVEADGERERDNLSGEEWIGVWEKGGQKQGFLGRGFSGSGVGGWGVGWGSGWLGRGRDQVLGDERQIADNVFRFSRFRRNAKSERLWNIRLD